MEQAGELNEALAADGDGEVEIIVWKQFPEVVIVTHGEEAEEG